QPRPILANATSSTDASSRYAKGSLLKAFGLVVLQTADSIGASHFLAVGRFGVPLGRSSSFRALLQSTIYIIRELSTESFARTRCPFCLPLSEADWMSFATTTFASMTRF